MWLSKRIESDPKTKETLCKLEGLIAEYQDATRLGEVARGCRSFFSTEMRGLRPSWQRFLLMTFLFAVGGGFSAAITDGASAEQWVSVSMAVIVPIFVIAVTITSVARSFSESLKFAEEYFNEACRMELYCCMALAAMLLGIVARVVAGNEEVWGAMRGMAGGASLGAVVSCVTGIAFIIRETVRCSRLAEAIKAASAFAARKLGFAFLSDAYLNVWMAKYEEVLEDWCRRELKAIETPERYDRSMMGEENGAQQKEICLGFDVEISKGYIDYHLGCLRRLDKKLKDVGALLFLCPHIWQQGIAQLGILQCAGVGSCGLVEEVEQLGENACKFRHDKHQQTGEREWRDLLERMGDALDKAIQQADSAKLEAYLGALTAALRAVEKGRESYCQMLWMRFFRLADLQADWAMIRNRFAGCFYLFIHPASEARFRLTGAVCPAPCLAWAGG